MPKLYINILESQVNISFTITRIFHSSVDLRITRQAGYLKYSYTATHWD